MKTNNFYTRIYGRLGCPFCGSMAVEVYPDLEDGIVFKCRDCGRLSRMSMSFADKLLSSFEDRRPVPALWIAPPTQKSDPFDA